MGVNHVMYGDRTLVDLRDNTVTPEKLFLGETAKNAAGEDITGEFTITSEMTEQDDLIEQIARALIGKASGGGSKGAIIESVEITENGTYTAPDGVDGYSPIVVNVPNDLDAMLLDTLISINSNITSVCGYACYSRTKLKTVNLPNASSIGTNAFRACTQLVQFNAPKAVTLGTYLFYVCSKLESANFPLATSIPNFCFGTCAAFVKADFGSATSVKASAFASSSKFETLILRSTTMATLENTNAFSGTKIASGTGYIYVPASLIDAYKVANNWSTYANQFRAIEDYPEICG